MAGGWLAARVGGRHRALGALIGVGDARAWLQPTLEFVRPLPASALMPLAISIFGLNPNMVLAVVAFGAMWPVLLATVHGFASVEPRLARGVALPAAEPRGLRRQDRPANALPDILAGMRLSLTISLIVSVVGDDRLAARPRPGDPARGAFSAPATSSPASCCSG